VVVQWDLAAVTPERLVLLTKDLRVELQVTETTVELDTAAVLIHSEAVAVAVLERSEFQHQPTEQ
jgi:hypothetical protein